MSTQDTFYHQGRGGTEPNTSRAGYGPLIHLLLQDAVGCRWSPFVPSHRPCCCLDRLSGAPVTPASERWNHLGLKPLYVGPQHLLLGLVKGVLCERVDTGSHQHSPTLTTACQADKLVQCCRPVSRWRTDPFSSPGLQVPEPTMFSKCSPCLCIRGN